MKELVGIASLTEEELKIKAKCMGSLLFFIRYFYELRTGRAFQLSHPKSNETHFITVCRELTACFRGETTRLMINLPPGWGKALDNQTPMFTQDGWKAAGEIAPGDKLVGSNGWTTVLSVHPQGVIPAKKVKFSDGASLICNDEHKWGVYDRYTPTLKTKTTAEIQSSISEADGRKHWRIPLINGEFGEIEPFIDPYLLGCWLGDGSSYYAAITTMDNEIVKAFESKGHTMKPHGHQSAGKAKSYGIIKNGFHTTLRKAGQIGSKHFPVDAYHWSKEHRLALLQGFMDTDGTCGKNGQPSFCNKNISLIDGVKFLVASLGGSASTPRPKNGSFNITLRLPHGMDVFRLPRKQDRVSTMKLSHPTRLISKIESVDDREMVCFTVDANDHLFAAGKDLVLTHNSEICKHFIAWAMTYYPDCNFLYVSHSIELAAKHTHGTKQIMEHPVYKKLFGIEIRQDSSAKDNFTTTKGGCVSGWGAKGGITGFDAGLPGQDRFSGCLLIDDIHKPDEVHSDTIRDHVKRNYTETLERRLRSPRVPVIFIGQRLHEDDLPANLLGDENSEFKGMDGQQWKRVVIKAIDDCGNAVYPELNPLEMMKNLKERSPYVYSSQYQQEPQPAGGSIFKPEWFVKADLEPDILGTFIIIDSAETDKTYNDATVLSHFGVYRIEKAMTETFGLHWLGCREIWVEPKDLEAEVMDFFAECSRHPKQPQLIGIEKKSTGTTLLSILKDYKGCRIVPIERHSASGSKTTRMLGIQPVVASRRVSLPADGLHTIMCIEHMRKITANNTHARDDIADTLVDGIQLGLIDRIIQATIGDAQVSNQHVAKRIMGNFNKSLKIKKRMSWR